MKNLRIIKDFFSKDEINFIKNYSEDVFKVKEILNSDKTNEWSKTLNTSNSRVIIYNIEPIIDQELFEIISKKIQNEFKMRIKGACFYYWLNNSNINWHNDGSHAAAVTIYLNKKWDRDWGGYFIYENDNNLGIEMPEYNKCIFQSGGIPHSTTPVTNEIKPRKTLQMFLG
jgi:hypothetical protein